MKRKEMESCPPIPAITWSIPQPATTAYGTVFQFSAAQRMSFLKNGSFYDIDQGVEPDYYIANVENYYNRAALTDYINGLF